ncbi:hypothetical protein BC936DRAFT_142968 [Jimgerdemannia flammicorona]|uniref:Uncharacterized protein n=2 Tax=Jimgerdemannia flammicorona TaxID=994334 RepID=A0A433DEJ9_9FUNG|nr:hypothetical protein BC936DRAFT_142968 [Jimgerdemannia flammicorona]RUS33068.1 hypothetical protein BC938DRAFT_473236 [Jimgerdemannia flammicorona]
MSRMLPEILREIFRYLQSSELDLIAASLACKSWYFEARPLVNDGALRFLNLRSHRVACRHLDADVEYLQRLSSLLTESRRLRLGYCDLGYRRYCDLVEEIRILPSIMNEKVQSGADAIHRVVKLRPANLHRICIGFRNQDTAPYRDCVMRLLDHIRALGQTITSVALGSVSLPVKSGQQTHEICLGVLDRFKDDIHEVSLNGVQLDYPIQHALAQCHSVERLALRDGLPPSSDPPAPATENLVTRFADAFPHLTRLIFYMRVGRGDRVTGAQLRDLMTRCPKLRELRLEVDETVDDECVRFLAQTARNLVELHLSKCTGVRGEDEWSEGDIRWRELKRLHIADATGVAVSFVEQVLRVCQKLENVLLSKYDEGLEAKFEEYGYQYSIEEMSWKIDRSIPVTDIQ